MILSTFKDIKNIFLLIMMFTTGCGNKPDLSRFNLAQGEQIYNNTCIACHLAGMSSAAPKIGSQRDWAARIDKGMETLLGHGLNGFNDMPPRGGKPNLSDDEVKDAVAYMVSKSW
jgi:cytochrome c5